MRRFYVEIREQAFDALAEIALAERRDVRDQAAVLLERTLRAEERPGRLTSSRSEAGAPGLLQLPATDAETMR